MRAGREAHPGVLFPAASTEVVMAERWNSMPCFTASAQDVFLTHSLIPVLVTGIQPRRVRAVNDSSHARNSPAPKDLGALDSCDKHRNEGWQRHAASEPTRLASASL